MSTNVDNRIVEMQFNNKKFEENVQTSMGTLEKLKKSLKFKDASKSFEELDKASDKLAKDGFGGMSSALETVKLKFSALDAIAFAALQRITNKAIDAGEKLVKNLTIDQISAGWSKYAEKTSAVQTIMAATASQFSDTGEQMAYVNSQLDKLNWFTDETSYNFVDMVNNIGKFTSNNIKLDDAVTAMQGIANWAAISGSNTQEASRAMYNLSQAISVGALKLIDWKSIQNANMGTAEFKQTAIDTAVALGTLTKAADGTYKTFKGNAVSVSNFEEALSDAWLTSDVLMNTLDKYGRFTNVLNSAVELTGLSTSELLTYVEDFQNGTLDIEEALKGTGLNATELEVVLATLSDDTFEFGRKAFRAAQEAKTFSEAISSVKDAASTAWMSTFETIFGNYTEAKKIWTKLANDLYEIFVDPINERNEILKEWAELGGRDGLLSGLNNIMEGLKERIALVREAFQEIFPPKTAEQLKGITDRFAKLTEKFRLNEEKAKKLKSTLKGVFAIFDILGTVVKSLASGAMTILKALFGGIGDSALDASASIGDLIVKFRDWLKNGNKFGNAVSKIVNAVVKLITTIKNLLKQIKEIPIVATALEKIKSGLSYFFNNFGDWIAAAINYIAMVIENFRNMDEISFENILKAFGLLGDDVGKFGQKVVDVVNTVIGAVKGFGQRVAANFVTASDGTDALNGSLTSLWQLVTTKLAQIDFKKVLALGLSVSFIVFLFKMSKTLNTLVNSVSNLTSPLKALSNAITNLKKESKAQEMLRYAVAIGILAASVTALSLVNHDKIWESVAVLGALAAGMFVFASAMAFLSKITKKSGGMAGGGIAILGIAAGVAILIGAMKSLQSFKEDDIWDSVLIVGVLAAALAGLGALLGVIAPKLLSSALFFVTFGLAIKVLVGALEDLQGIKLDTISKPLMELMGAFALISIASGLGKGRGAIAILATVLSLKILLTQIKELESLKPETLTTVINNILKLLSVFALLMVASLVTGKNAARAGVMLLAASASIAILVTMIKKIVEISNADLVKGVAVIGALDLMFILLIKSTKNAQKCAGTMVAMTLVLTMLAGALLILSLINTRDIIGAAITLGIALLALSQVFKTMGNMRGVKTGPMISMTIILGILVGIMALVSFFDDPTLIKSLVTIAALVTMLSFLAKSLSKMKTSKSAYTSILMMAIIFAEMIGMIALMKTMDLAQALISTGSVVAIIGAMIGVIAVLKKLNPGSNAMRNLIVIGAIFAAITAIMGIFASSYGQQNPLSIAAFAGGISIMILALAATAKILSKSGNISMGVIGKVALLSAIMLGIGGVMALLIQYGPDFSGSIPLAVSLSTMIIALSTACAILSLVPVVPIAGLAGLGILITGMGALAALLGADFMSDVREAINTGLPLLEQFGLSLGHFFGNIFGGIIESIATAIGNASAAIPVIGDNLSAFSESIKPFLETFSSEDYDTDRMISLAKALAATAVAIAAIGAADIYTGLVTLFNGGESPVEKLMSTMTSDGVVDGLKKLSSLDVDADKMKTIAEALYNIAMAAASIPSEGGLWQKIVGGKSLEDFANSFGTLGDGLTSLSVNTENVSTANIQKACTCLKAIAEASDAIGNSGGILADIVGDNDLDDFADQFEDLANGLTKLSDGTEDVSKDNIDVACACLESIATASKKIPNTGGLVAEWIGDNDLKDFASKFDNLGAGLCTLNTFMESVKVENIQNAVDCMSILAEAASNIDSDVEIEISSKWFNISGSSTSNFEKFVDMFSNVGPKLTKIGNEAANVDHSAIAAISADMTALANTFKAIKDSGVFGRTYNASALLNAFSDIAYDGIDEMISAYTNSIPAVKNSIVGIIDAIKSTLEYLSPELNTKFLDVFSDSIPDYDTSKQTFDPTIKSLIGGIVAKLKTTIDDEMPETGKYVVKGLIKGINENKDDAKEAGKNLALSLNSGFREGADINSPSGEFEKYAGYCVDGLIIGFAKAASAANSAGENIAEEAVDGVNRRVKKETGGKKTSSALYKGGVAYGENFGSGVYDGITKYELADIVPAAKELAASGADVTSGLMEQFGIGQISDPVYSFLGNAFSDLGTTAGTQLAESTAAAYTGSTVIEESVEDKIKKIVEAYEDSLKYFETRKSTVDYEYQLWEKTIGLDADDSEKLAKEIEMKTAQRAIQIEKVAEAQKKYQEILEVNGATAKETQEYYNEYLQEQITLAGYTADIRDAQKKLLESQKTEAETRKTLVREYAKLMRESKDDLEELGFTLEEIQNWAALKSGYAYVDPAFKDLISKTTDTIEDGYTDVIDAGYKYGSGLGEGIQNGSESSVETLTSAMSSYANTISEHTEEWKTAGKTLMTTFADAIRAELPSVQQAITEVTDNSKSFLNQAIAKITAALKEDLDNVVTITPVLDLSKLERDVKTANGLVAQISTRMAGNVSSRMNEIDYPYQNYGAYHYPGSTVNFTQNNYSPKALSQAEIYRRTYNQISILKRKAGL